jgi:hypothetical protein
MSLWFATRCAALAVAVLAIASCKAENKNDVSCAPEDCASSCASLGFPGGACEDGVCACDTTDTDPFEWDGGDADADTDTDTEAVPDGGAKLG